MFGSSIYLILSLIYQKGINPIAKTINYEKNYTKRIANVKRHLQ